MNSFSFFAVSVLSVAAPLIKKKIPVATPSSAKVNPAPQKTAGPRLGGTAAISGTPVDHCKGCERYTCQCCNLSQNDDCCFIRTYHLCEKQLGIARFDFAL